MRGRAERGARDWSGWPAGREEAVIKERIVKVKRVWKMVNLWTASISWQPDIFVPWLIELRGQVGAID